MVTVINKFINDRYKTGILTLLLIRGLSGAQFVFITKKTAIVFITFFLTLTGCWYDKIPIAPDSGIIRTKVIDAMTGPTMLYASPMEGAEVYTYPASVMGITNEDGDVFLENVSVGWYNVYAAKNGYYTSYYNAEVYSKSISEVRILLRPLIKNNDYPEKPKDPFPRDSMKIYSNYISLEWICTDPNEDILYFDVFFGKENPPVKLVRFNNLDKFYQIDTLDGATTYYWRINAKDYFGAITEGDIWSFRTK